MSGQRTQGHQNGVPDTPDRPVGITTASGRLLDLDHRDGTVTLTSPGVHTVTLTLDGARELVEALPAMIAAAKADRAPRGGAAIITLVPRRS